MAEQKMTQKEGESKPSYTIYIGAKGHRYVKPNEVRKDPEMKRRFLKADQLASDLGLKQKQRKSSTPALD